MRLEGIEDRTAAEALRGEELLRGARAGARAGRRGVVGARTRGVRRARRRARGRDGRRLVELPSCEVLEVGAPRAASCWYRWSATPCAMSTSPRDASTSTSSSWERNLVEIDVFTLFPEWFGWFYRAAPRRQRASGRARPPGVRRLSATHTPLSGGQVDDTPFGGGAGMVLRVDVVEAALRARYGIDPVELRERRRVIALAPGGPAARRRARARARARAGADAAVRPLRGLRRADRRALRQRDALDRPVRALRRRARRDGRLRRGAAQAPGRARTTRARPLEESFSEALEGNPEYPHYTRPAEYRGWRVPDVLLSGHHERIASWRRERSRERARQLGSGRPAAGRRRTDVQDAAATGTARSPRPLPLRAAPEPLDGILVCAHPPTP